jgi:SAM-dependent MidA family methyltransferase
VDWTSTQQIGSLIEEVKVQLHQTKERRIPFARLMELALYHPTYGYYTKPTPKLGKAGDFFTNVHVSDLFGRILANYFVQLWQGHSPSNKLSLVEMGSGDGRLMEQVAKELSKQGIPSSEVCFYSIERSPYHRSLQRERLTPICYPIFWVDSLTQIPTSSFAIIYSNECVDAFPVHPLKMKKGKWLEMYVTEQADKLVETYGVLSSDALHTYCKKITEEVVEGQRIEVNLQAKKWLQEITEWLQHGFLLTVDYGGTSRELCSIRYLEGTMRYYRSHQHVDDPYGVLGDVDMTAHVNFDDLIHWGKEYDLTPHFYGTQAKFLMDAGILSFTGSHYVGAIKQLLYGMGENFQVLVQLKNS